MKKEIKELWVQALRSGEYNQSFCSLNNGIGYCCLGVLCDLAVKDGVGEWRSNGNMAFYYGTGIHESKLWLSGQVLEWAGIKEPDPNVHGEKLSTWNDKTRLSFAEIADLIEEFL